MSFETVPCPMCCNGKTPGQLERPLAGWPRNEFPPHVMAVPCPLCHGEGEISRDSWTQMSAARRKPVPEKKTEKEHSKKVEKKELSWWDKMQAIQRQVEQDWKEQGPFDLSSYRKVD